MKKWAVRPFPCGCQPESLRIRFRRTESAWLFHRNGSIPDIFTALIEGNAAHPKLGKAELFLGTPFSERDPAFSPDGRWLAYASNESGTAQIYVRPFPGPGGRWQISTGGGLFPLWSHDGRVLLFETLDQHVMAVSYTAKGDLVAAGKPRVWTETRLRNTLSSTTKWRRTASASRRWSPTSRTQRSRLRT